MNLYAYTGILTKTLLMKGKVTYTDKRASRGTLAIPLHCQCVTGHVLGETAEQAKEHAVALLQRTYPAEQHYANHGNVSVQYVEEQEV